MACSNKEAVEKFVVEFNDMIKKEGYLPEQVFTQIKQGYFGKDAKQNLLY